MREIEFLMIFGPNIDLSVKPPINFDERPDLFANVVEWNAHLGPIIPARKYNVKIPSMGTLRLDVFHTNQCAPGLL